jgi:mono/diheme cytochrome c family protein
MHRPILLSFLTYFALTIPVEAADDASEREQAYAQRIHPLLVKTCGKCHGKEPEDNDLDIASLATAQAILAQPKVLEDIAERLNEGDMPPKKAPQPSLAERDQLLGWISAALDAAAMAQAGDPGPVTLRRLTNAEYDHAVRDLTGVDMRPTVAGEFAPDSVGGEGFANVGEAMPMTPGLVERYHQAARHVAARAVLLPTGIRFSTSTERPDWTAEAEKALRSFHSRYADHLGRPPLAAHLAATLKHRERLTKGGAAAVTAVAREEKLNATYLATLWAGLNGTSATSLPTADLAALTKQWEQKEAERREKAEKAEVERRQMQAALDSARQKIGSRWSSSKRVVAQSKVADGGSVPFDRKVSVQRGELLLLTVSPNESHGADSTLLEWTIQETGSGRRTWALADLVPDLMKGNPWPDEHGARWTFLETTSSPTFLRERRESISGRSELKSWSLGPEPSVFVNTAAEAIKAWTTLPARSFFVHPGPRRPVTVAWTSPIAGEVSLTGRVADVHSSGGDGVAFEVLHLAAPDLGEALAGLAAVPAPLPPELPSVSLPPDVLAFVREKWRAATTDPAPVLAAIKIAQDRLFWDRYRKHSVLAVGNGFPAWEDTLRVVAREQVQTAAREPVFRLIARQVAPAQSGTFVVWENLRLEGGDAPAMRLAEHPELRAAIETACGLRFGNHPRVQKGSSTALVTEAGSEVRIDLKSLPAPLTKLLALPRFLRADVSLAEGSPATATVQAVLLAEPDFRDAGDPKKLNSQRTNPSTFRSGDPLIIEEPEPRVAQIVHPRVAAERARPAAEFRALFPPAVLFEPIIPRDAQGSLFMFHREDEPLRRLLLDETGRAELERLWSELHFLREDAHAHALMYAELLKFYANPNGAPRMDFFFNPVIGERVKREEEELLAQQTAAEPKHLGALLDFAGRAWRRSLSADERETLLASYRADRAEGIKHDPALRAALARVLSSPWFLYRVEQPAEGPRWQPVSGDELATRLSFLLWDSIPDDELRAAAPRLHEPAVIEAQVRRMIKDSRTRGMAEEFGARWLGVRDFVNNHGRSLKDFPEFTPAVRDALAEEPVRFFEDLLINDRAVSDVIATDTVLVNDVLAKHYGIPGVKGPEWRRVENVAAYGRGGLLGLGAVLAKQSAAARTSPIKRGAWVAHMLGDRLPNPPANVPPLPDAVPAGLSVRELTERHRSDANCAACHVRIDPYGMTLEQFDAIGRLRPASAMKPGESHATLRDGTDVNDFAGLRNYVAGPRREDLLRTLARKLTGYALSRAVLPSDRALVDEVSKTMINGGRWSDALLVIVRSESFRCIRPASS